MRDWIWVVAVSTLACTPTDRSSGEGMGGTVTDSDGGSDSEPSAGATVGGGGVSGVGGKGQQGGAAGSVGDAGAPGEECGGCLIGGTCLADGAQNPANPCEVCDIANDREAFSADDGKRCDDGSRCTLDDRCEAGVCEGSERDCPGASSGCDEQTGSCTCDGCTISNTCVESGAQNPGNPCEYCTPTASTSAYSPNTGASCGPTSECNAGTCQALQNPFDCIAPTPPVSELPDDRFVGITTTPPSPKGGTIAAGSYVPVRIDVYGEGPTGVDLRTFEFSKSFVQIATRYYNLSNGAAYIPEVQHAGSYTSASNRLTFAVERCDPQYDIDVPSLSYTASAKGLTIIETLEGGVTLVTSYTRQ